MFDWHACTQNICKYTHTGSAMLRELLHADIAAQRNGNAHDCDLETYSID